MLHVDYKNPYGYYTLTQKQEYGVKKFKITLCRANCLWADIYFYKNEEKKSMVNPHAFSLDTQHLERCLKNHVYDEANNFVLYAKEIQKESQIWKAIRILTKYGKTVTIK